MLNINIIIIRFFFFNRLLGPGWGTWAVTYSALPRVSAGGMQDPPGDAYEACSRQRQVLGWKGSLGNFFGADGPGLFYLFFVFYNK